MQPEPVLKNGLYFVADKPYSGTLKVLHYSAEDLYDVNFMGVVYPRAKPLPPTLIREIDVKDGTAVLQCDYFDGRDKPSNEYPLKNGLYDGVAKSYYVDGGELKSQSEYKAGKREGFYKLYYQGSGKLKQQGAYKADRREGVFTDYYESGEVSARHPYKGGLRNDKDVDYYKSGKVRGERSYKGGKRQGVERWYHDNGALREMGANTGFMKHITKTVRSRLELRSRMVWRRARRSTTMQTASSKPRASLSAAGSCALKNTTKAAN